MGKHALALCGAGLLAAVLVAGAAAEKPIREPATPPTFAFPAGVACPFALGGEPVESNQTQTTYASGRAKITGHFVGRLTNLDNGKSITVNAPGSVRLVPEGDNLRLVSGGPVIFSSFPGDAGPGDVSTGRTYLTHGHTEVLVDPATFTFLSFQTEGKVTDLCAALA